MPEKSTYINSGVVLINIKELRKNQSLVFPDQDALKEL
jgi:hypothetical protein